LSFTAARFGRNPMARGRDPSSVLNYQSKM